MGATPKMVGFQTTTMGFPTKNDPFWGVLGIPAFEETPTYIWPCLTINEYVCKSYRYVHSKCSFCFAHKLSHFKVQGCEYDQK